MWGKAAWEWISDNKIRAMVRSLRARNYLPIVLIFPHDLHEKREMFGERKYLSFCRAENVHFINLRRIFLTALENGGSEAVLMRDAAHLSRAAGKIFARFVSDVLDRMAVSRPAANGDVRDDASFRVIPSSELFAAGRLIEWSSSYRSAIHGRLGIGDVLQIPIDADERLAAIMINTGAFGGTVAVSNGERTATKCMTIYRNADLPDQFHSILVDIVQPIKGGRQGATIEIVAEGTSPSEGTLEGRPTIPAATARSKSKAS